MLGRRRGRPGDRHAGGRGVRVADFSLGQPSLDEVFLALTGHTAEEETTDAIEEKQAA